MLEEFKNFLFRGNIVELAVAFVIGVAFAMVVNSLVDNLVMPIIAMIIGKPDFSSLTFTINDAVFRYGAFITDVIQFVAIAAAVYFFVVKPVQMMQERSRKSPVEEGMPDEERRHQELRPARSQLANRGVLVRRTVAAMALDQDIIERADAWQRAIEARDEAAADFLASDFALVVTHPDVVVVPRDVWLRLLPDYDIRAYEIQHRSVETRADWPSSFSEST